MSGLVSEEVLPPMALHLFIQKVGVSRKTVSVWRKRGILKTVNIYGRVYVPAKEVVEFNRRAEAGELHKDPTGAAAEKSPRK